jgi:hypothetical protein
MLITVPAQNAGVAIVKPALEIGEEEFDCEWDSFQERMIC